MHLSVEDFWYIMWNSRINLIKEVQGHRIIIHADFGGDDPVFVIGCETCRKPTKAYMPLAKISIYRVNSIDELFRIIEKAIKEHIKGLDAANIEYVKEIAQKYGYAIQRTR